ncbi:MAG TPA: tRNA(His) guanylyltransferase Thg1 family protein [Chthonomonadaceae bacterium]|nr:tRNA(His) guanylyltransferase Thg1 family protein [Chthonomonadaceae bacterium]
MQYDALGSRIKRQYEQRCRHFLPRRSYIVIRVDGRAFHEFTRDCARPFDWDLIGDMNAVGLALCGAISGTQLAFIQSDEVSVLVTDFRSLHSEAWFDNNQSKIESITASIATAAFNRSRFRRLAACSGVEALEREAWAEFDSRAFLVPDVNEVANVFVWRQQDAVRNSIQMVAHAHFSHAELEGKSTDALQEMLWQTHGINWNDYDPSLKRGRFVERQTRIGAVEYVDKRTGQPARAEGVERHEWVIVTRPTFTRDRAWLMGRIPRVDAEWGEG